MRLDRAVGIGLPPVDSSERELMIPAVVVTVHVAEMEIPRTHVVPQLTVDELLADQSMIDVNMACSSRISANIAILKEATGVTDEEIYPCRLSLPTSISPITAKLSSLSKLARTSLG